MKYFFSIIWLIFFGCSRSKHYTYVFAESEKKSGYFSVGDDIYYQGSSVGSPKFLIDGADKNTFSVSSQRLAKDSEKVYFENTPIENVDMASLEILNSCYFKDKFHVYYSGSGKPIPGVDIESFEVAGSHPHAKDKNQYYYLNQKAGDYVEKYFELTGE